MLSISIGLNAVSIHAICTAIFVAVAAVIGFMLASIQTLGRISWLAWAGLICILTAGKSPLCEKPPNCSNIFRSLYSHHCRWHSRSSSCCPPRWCLGFRLQGRQQPQFRRSRHCRLVSRFCLRGHSSLLLRRIRDARSSPLHSIIDHLPVLYDNHLCYNWLRCVLLLWLLRCLTCSRVCRSSRQESGLWLCFTGSDRHHDHLHSCKCSEPPIKVDAQGANDCIVPREIHLCPPPPRVKASHRQHRDPLGNLVELHRRRRHHRLRHCQRRPHLQ